MIAYLLAWCIRKNWFHKNLKEEKAIQVLEYNNNKYSGGFSTLKYSSQHYKQTTSRPKIQCLVNIQWMATWFCECLTSGG
jgi:hypothetical protein